MTDDNEDKPPPLRLVSDNSSAHVDRQTARAKDEVERTLCQFAASLLRTMAGNDTEAVYLIRRLGDFIDAFKEFHKVSGRGLMPEELKQMLQLPQAECVSSKEEWRYRHWLREDGFDDIVKGALRLAAHKVLGDDPAFGGMHSERVIERGIKSIEQSKQSPAETRSRKQRKSLAASWGDVDPGPAPAAPTPRRFGERLARDEFSQHDLKELRKAIKAKDEKKIAELTAKIGKPTDKA